MPDPMLCGRAAAWVILRLPRAQFYLILRHGALGSGKLFFSKELY